MPINFDTLKLTTDFMTVEHDASVSEIYNLLPNDRRDSQAFTYILAALPDGRYIVVRWVEIEEIARRAGPGTIRPLKLTELADLPEPTMAPQAGGYAKFANYSFADLLRLLTPVEAVEQKTTTTQEARELRDAHPGDRLVVLDNGVVRGFLANEKLAGDTLGKDPFKRGGGTSILDIEDTASPTRGQGQPKTPITSPAATAGDEPEKEKERGFNYWMVQLNEDGNTTTLPNTAPLKLGLTYELKINLAAPRDDSFARTDAQNLVVAEEALSDEQQFYDVQIILSTEHFTLYGSTEQILTIARGGFSKNAVSFTLEPKKAGVGTLTASFFMNGHCFQMVEFTLKVGGSPGTKPALEAKATRGKPISQAMKMAARLSEQNYSLVIIKRDAGYQFILNGGGVKRANINVTEEQISQQIDKARTVLKEIVGTEGPDLPIYQTEITKIPPDVNAASIKKLAREGTLLFERLFFNGQNEDAKAMGNLIKKLSQERQLHIEIIAEKFIMPWAILYDGNVRGVENPDPKGFWGFKHVIEYLPEYTTANPVNFVPEISVKGSLPISLVFNTHIDEQLNDLQLPTVIEQQAKFFQQLPNVTTTRLTTKQEFISLLNNADAPPLIYINCHAVSNPEGDGGSAYRSRIQLSDGDIDMDDFDFDIPIMEGGLKNAPLVFLNACQSAELRPQLYVGLVPALIARGIRGVIGTEVDTPAVFAAEFAKEFIKRFAAGNKPLGELLLELRLEYLEQKNNIMGLVYALYSSGEVVIKRIA